MKKILQVGPVASGKQQSFGGMQAYMEGLLDTNLSSRYHVFLLNTSVPPIYKKIRLLRPFLTLVFLSKLVYYLLLERPDIAHIHMSEGLNGSGIIEKRLFACLCRWANTKIVLHLHGATLNDFYRKNTAYFSRMLNSSDRNIVLARSWQKLFSATVEVAKINVIPNAIWFSDYDYSARDSKELPVKILFIGAVGKRKGLSDLGEAISLLGNNIRQKIHLDIVGPEEFNGELKEMTLLFLKLGLSNISTFHGPVFGDAKMEFYKRADIFILPSRNESFGIVNLEAMAASLPIISTFSGAIPEYIEDGVNGILVKPGDIKKLAHSIETLVEKPELRRIMGMRNRTKVRDEYDWKKVVSSIANIYDELVLEDRRINA